MSSNESNVAICFEADLIVSKLQFVSAVIMILVTCFIFHIGRANRVILNNENCGILMKVSTVFPSFHYRC